MNNRSSPGIRERLPGDDRLWSALSWSATTSPGWSIRCRLDHGLSSRRYAAGPSTYRCGPPCQDLRLWPGRRRHTDDRTPSAPTRRRLRRLDAVAATSAAASPPPCRWLGPGEAHARNLGIPPHGVPHLSGHPTVPPQPERPGDQVERLGLTINTRDGVVGSSSPSPQPGRSPRYRPGWPVGGRDEDDDRRAAGSRGQEPQDREHRGPRRRADRQPRRGPRRHGAVRPRRLRSVRDAVRSRRDGRRSQPATTRGGRHHRLRGGRVAAHPRGDALQPHRRRRDRDHRVDLPHPVGAVRRPCARRVGGAGGRHLRHRRRRHLHLRASTGTPLHAGVR
ncbi:hypothetical protein B0E53_01388 [Micromonospora sp. MH33]|nr:hypothetical protein B0E53_01388 [Micromonospora sp. MH33]